MSNTKKEKQEKSNKFSETLVSVLIIIIGGAIIVGAFYLGKIIGFNSIGNAVNEDVIIIDHDPIKEEFTDITDDKDLISKLDSTFLVPTTITPVLRSGLTDKFVDFAKIYLSLYNLSNNKSNKKVCSAPYTESDGCFSEEDVLKKAKELFGDDVTLVNKDYLDFNTYSFSNSKDIHAKYDEDNKYYVVKNLYSDSNDTKSEYLIKVPYRLIKKDNTYKLSYYMVYKTKGEVENEYIYYINENKNKKIFTLRNDEIKDEENRIITSPINSDFKRITLTFEKNSDNYKFIEYLIEN